MASELHVDAIKHSGGTSAITINSSGNVKIPDTIVQTVQTINRTLVSTSSSTYAEASTNFRCSITPKFSTSKLLITATIGISGFNNSGSDLQCWTKLYDVSNSADISNSESPYRNIDYGGSGTGFSTSQPTIILQNFPNANEITITWYYRMSAGVGLGVNDDHRLTQIMLQEIAQ